MPKTADFESNKDLFLSIIICNYNYGLYVSAAIQSALLIDWPNVEVIVVDDGSTDDSVQVIGRYAKEIRFVQQTNKGQREAYNTGFAYSTGDIVIFLDSDDLLDTSIMCEIGKVWHSTVSKVQVQMTVIDHHGRFTGSLLPQFYTVPSPQDVVKWISASGAMPTPPGSGNAYSRTFLKSIFPLMSLCGEAGDSYTIAAAPFLGEIITIPKPLASYRIHGKNDGAMLKLDSLRFAREVKRTIDRFQYSTTVPNLMNVKTRSDALERNLNLGLYRLSSFKLESSIHPIDGDSLLRIFLSIVKSLITPQGIPSRSLVVIIMWATAVAISPTYLAKRLIAFRYSPSSRPKVVLKVLRYLRILRAHPRTYDS